MKNWANVSVLYPTSAFIHGEQFETIGTAPGPRHISAQEGGPSSGGRYFYGAGLSAALWPVLGALTGLWWKVVLAGNPSTPSQTPSVNTQRNERAESPSVRHLQLHLQMAPGWTYSHPVKPRCTLSVPVLHRHTPRTDHVVLKLSPFFFSLKIDLVQSF